MKVGQLKTLKLLKMFQVLLMEMPFLSKLEFIWAFLRIKVIIVHAIL